MYPVGRLNLKYEYQFMGSLLLEYALDLSAAGGTSLLLLARKIPVRLHVAFSVEEISPSCKSERLIRASGRFEYL